MFGHKSESSVQKRVVRKLASSFTRENESPRVAISDTCRVVDRGPRGSGSTSDIFNECEA